jgi:hypothetical protein
VVGGLACWRVGVLAGLGVLADARLALSLSLYADARLASAICAPVFVQSLRVAGRTQLLTQLLHIVCHAIYVTGG